MDLQHTQSFYPWKFFSELHVPRVSYCINFIIFRAIDQPVLIKLALTQPEIVAGAKATFPKHEYFSSEDLNLRKPTKFSLHFLHFSLILYEFFKPHTKQTKKNSRPPPTPTDQRAPPAVEQREQGLPCSAPAMPEEEVNGEAKVELAS